MGTRITQSSFTRGELSPRLDARTQLEQYGIGLKTAKNAIIHQEGGISNRMGLEYCGVAKYNNKATRLIKFVFNSEQTYMLEFGNQYMRVLKDGGYVVYPTGHAHEGEIVEITTPYAAADLAKLKRSQSGDILTLTHPNYKPKTISRYDHHDWRIEDTVIAPSVLAPTGVTASFHWGSGADQNTNTRNYKYIVTAVDSNNEESKRSSSVTKKGHREASWLADEYMTISWTAVTGAVEYNVYREVNGVYGYIGTANSTTFTDDNIEPDLQATAPVYKNPFSTSNDYPSCSAYFQQRKIYANSQRNPQVLWASQTAAPNNFNVSRPLVATDSITLAMDDREVNEIRHLIPMKDLIVLTSNSEWKVNGTDGVFQANPMPAAVIQSCYGASHIEPVVSGSMVLFVQAGGSVIRDLGYDIMTEGYDGDELSLFSSHLFEGKEVVSMAYAKEPYRLLFVVFDDGTAATMTYNKKQKLCGWTQLVTQGEFECVDVVREGLEDVAYFVIKRHINGQDVKFIERTRTRIIEDTSQAFLVDCGLSATFVNPVSTISGLDHLEGETVICNVNGGIIEGLTVENGSITLPNNKKASSIVVGLPYEFELETLNVEGENTQGLKKLINRVSVKIYKSREDFVFCGADDSEFRHSRCDDSINHAGHLYSKDVSSTVFALPKTDTTIKLKQNYPLPLTILSISAVVDVQNNEND